MLSPRLQRLYAAAVAHETFAHCGHELRNVLGGISTSTFLVRRRLRHVPAAAVDERLTSALETIDRRVLDATDAGAVRTLLPTETSADVPIADVLTEVVASFSPRSVQLEPLVDAGRTIFARRDELELALHCLVENAVDATPGARTVRLRVRDSGGVLLFAVLDEGAGLDPDLLGSAIRPFFTTKPGRLGMGLPIARRLLARLGARLTLEPSAQGMCAAFAVGPAGR